MVSVQIFSTSCCHICADAVWFLTLGISKTAVENVCRVLGVPLITSSGFYQIGEPLTRLEEFYAERDCILISEEDVEIEFVQYVLPAFFRTLFSWECETSCFGFSNSYWIPLSQLLL